ncbi:hypothetical protein A0H81_09186 [Grifola frondosa]|uniref:Uncharacterized protein n=1 Tax=Grifola frondosa TaxID=5627 RepID=A0A1C7M369_GRIFR|nr:hypothetical protein A0H81_09186 [Grifola frondosa]
MSDLLRTRLVLIIPATCCEHTTCGASPGGLLISTLCFAYADARRCTRWSLMVAPPPRWHKVGRSQSNVGFTRCIRRSRLANISMVHFM